MHLFHRGKIDGGRRGIGMNGFWKEFNGERYEVVEGDTISTLALVAALGNPEIAQQVAQYVYEVNRIKTKLLKSNL